MMKLTSKYIVKINITLLNLPCWIEPQKSLLDFYDTSKIRPESEKLHKKNLGPQQSHPFNIFNFDQMLVSNQLRFDQNLSIQLSVHSQ